MLYANWFQQTGANVQGNRSAPLRAIDAALQAYHAGPTAQRLKVLDDALVAWQASKRTFFGNENWANSKRSAVTVIALAKWVGEQYIARNLWPRPETGYNNNHNCYAYAMKCKNPLGAGNNSRPGKFAAHGQNPDTTTYGRQAPGLNWKEEMVEAIKADGVANGTPITGGVRESPLPVPGTVADGRYLVALIGFRDGYHFLRRDEGTRRWSHKNGAPSPVETMGFHNIKGRAFVLDDATVADIIQNPGNWDGVTRQMQFIAYLSVPDAGITVKG